MKKRHGFVSNSSSSSFVICKEFLTEKQLTALKKWHDNLSEQEVYFGEGGDYFDESDNYVSAEVRNVFGDFEKFCKGNNIDMSKIHWIEG